MKRWSIIVHGGAGAIAERFEQAHRSGCRRAAEAGAGILRAGGSALEAVVCAVRMLEDDPTFNAGVGGMLDARGIVTHDASICRASDLGYGAAAAFCGVRHPIELARAVLEAGEHCLLAGPSAVAFARARGLSLVDPQFFVTQRTQAAFDALVAREARGERRDPAADWKPELPSGEFERSDSPGSAPRSAPDPADDSGPDRGNTVGAVAMDTGDEICAATSTGGTALKTPGRVGDSPIAGHGTYADPDLGGLSATGHGETMMRTVFALTALQTLKHRASEEPSTALRRALDGATARVGGRGGAIALLPCGTPVHARNTLGMGVAYQTSETRLETAFNVP